MLFKDKNILINGGLGFIGSNLAHECLKQGAKVTILDIHDKSLNSNIYNIEDIKNSITLLKGDIRIFDDISNAVKNQDIIFNCAGQTSHPISISDPQLDIDINCKGTINVLEAVRKFNDKARVIYIGTSTQVGKMHYSPVNEEHPEFPRDIYSANKTVAEKYNLIYNYIYGLNTTVIRSSNLFGPRAAIHSPDYGFMNYFIGLALKNKEVTIYGEGRQKRTVTFISDLIDAILKATQSERCIGETLFATGDLRYSVKQIAEIIVNIIGTGKVKHIDWPELRKKVEVGDAIIDNSKIKKLLDWEPKYDLSLGIIETKNFYKDRLHKYI